MRYYLLTGYWNQQTSILNELNLENLLNKLNAMDYTAIVIKNPTTISSLFEHDEYKNKWKHLVVEPIWKKNQHPRVESLNWILNKFKISFSLRLNNRPYEKEDMLFFELLKQELSKSGIPHFETNNYEHNKRLIEFAGISIQ
jgi:hypothetical protein